jgi:glycerophosphoryl diester phosphodiesterase
LGLLSGIKLSWLWIKKLFASCPKRYKRKKQNIVFIICGHRGSPTKEIENTIPSFCLAMNEGANSVETDLCITKDKVVVLWHDWNPDEIVALLREKGLEPDVKYKPYIPQLFNEKRKKISELTYNEFSEGYCYIEKGSSIPLKIQIPILEDFFSWAIKYDSLYSVFLDLKVPASESELAVEIISQVQRLVDQYKPKFKIIIETFGEKILLLLKENFSEFKFTYDAELKPGIVLLPRKYSGVKKAIKYANEIAVILRPRIITIANWVTFRRLMRFEVKKQRRYNRKNPDKKVKHIVGCTINNEGEMDCLIRIGISGMQTDYPNKLLRIAKNYNLKICSEKT